MPGQPVDVGPFLGGLNDRAEMATIADDELALVENFDIDTDGSLKSRPAIVEQPSTGAPTGNMNPLGCYVRNDGATFLVVATDSDTRLFDVAGESWQTIWSNPASGFVQYDNKIVLCRIGGAGGYWEAGTFTSTPTMPAAAGIVFYQGRFWAWGQRGTANATTVWFSKLTVISPPSSIFDWTPTTDFFTISAGDGQWVTSLVADTNALLIFRNSSTYQFTFPASPIQGTLRVLSATTGADNRWSVAPYENYYIVFHAGTLYQFINYRYYPLSTKKIIFRRQAIDGALLADIRVSIFNRRAMVWFYGALYVYNLVTSTWTRWDSPPTRACLFLEIPASSITADAPFAFAVTGEDSSAKKKLWRISDDVINVGAGEEMLCRVRTKAYAFGENSRFKRLYFWAVRIRSARGIEASLNPVTIPIEGTTWNEMNNFNWNDFGTWNNPLVLPVRYDDDVNFPALAPVMSTVRLVASLRFLLMYADITLECDGTAATSPSRIYAITPYLGVKADTSRKVS